MQYIRLLPIVVIYWLAGCGIAPTKPATPAPAPSPNQLILAKARQQIKTGDVVLRSGRDFTSYRIRDLSQQDKTYSHAGIAYVQDTIVYIYHIVPPDVDEDKGDSIMRRETLEQFAKPAKDFGVGIVRYSLSNIEINRAVACADSLYRQKTAFDHLFDLREHHQQYCSEMIDYILRAATAGRIQLTTNTFDTTMAKRVARYLHATVPEVMVRKYIPIDHIQHNPYCVSIADYLFQNE